MRHQRFVMKSGRRMALMAAGLLLTAAPQVTSASGLFDVLNQATKSTQSTSSTGNNSSGGGGDAGSALIGGLLGMAAGGSATDAASGGSLEDVMLGVTKDMAKAGKLQREGLALLASTYEAHNSASLILMGARDASYSILKVMDQLHSGADKIKGGMKDLNSKILIARKVYKKKAKDISKFKKQAREKAKNEAVGEVNYVTPTNVEMVAFNKLHARVDSAKNTFMARARDVSRQSNKQKINFIRYIVAPVNDNLAYSTAYLEETTKGFGKVQKQLDAIDRRASKASAELMKVSVGIIASLTLQTTKISGQLARLKSNPIANAGEIGKMLGIIKDLGSHIKTLESHNSKIREANSVLSDFIAVMNSSKDEFVRVVRNSKEMMNTVDQVTDSILAAAK